MSVRKKIVLATAIAGIGIAGYFVGRVLYAVNHVPEAYAAWDTGSLLIAYMQSHDGRWPHGWDDLLSVVEGEGGQPILLRGAEAGDGEYLKRLRTMVAVDWSFDPATSAPDSRPVTRPDGSRFRMLWQAGDPNKMVHRYIEAHGNAPPPDRE
jgi:hypothetical protein